MPELSAIEFGLLAIMLVLGLVLGWIARTSRCAKEKMAVNAGWQEQIAAQKSEHERIAKQNKGLMEQISENQASHKDSKMRAQELSDALKETFAHRDELQGQAKDLRDNLDAALGQRDKLQAQIEKSAETGDRSSKEKDDKIFYLSRELQSWQDRVPPLVERFQTRNLEAQQLETDLHEARERIAELERMPDSDQTRIESVSGAAISDGLNASNDQFEETAEHTLADQPIGAFDEISDSSLEVSDQTSIDAANSERADNLRMIKGVGPAIEKTLNDLGIFRFDQIAAMTEYEIDRVAQRLRGFRGRIYREDWVGQARTLEHQKNNEPG